MTISEMQRRYGAVIFQRNSFVATSLFLLALVGLLAFSLSQKQQRVVLIPSRVADGMIAYGAKDTRYIEALALDTVYAMFNISPSSTEYTKTVLTRITTAASRAEILDAVDQSTRDYKRRKITTTFFPRSIEYHLENDRVIIAGILKTFISNSLVASEEKLIAVIFKPEAGSYRVHQIKELDPDAVK